MSSFFTSPVIAVLGKGQRFVPFSNPKTHMRMRSNEQSRLMRIAMTVMVEMCCLAGSIMSRCEAALSATCLSGQLGLPA